jgi:hypothetical protein
VTPGTSLCEGFPVFLFGAEWEEKDSGFINSTMKYTPTHSSFRVFSESDLHHWITESSGRLVEDFKTAQQIFARQGADPNDIKQSLDQYRKFSAQNVLRGDEKNIDSWAKQGWDKFKDFLAAKFNETHREQYILRDDPEWLLVIPLNHNASCYHGTNTDWCVAKKTHSYFQQYVFKDQQILVYCIQKATKKKWAVLLNRNGEFVNLYDQQDQSLDENAFTAQTGLRVKKIETQVKKHLSELRTRIQTQRAMDVSSSLEDAISSDERNIALERNPKIWQHPQLLMSYFNRFPEALTPDAVAMIAKNPFTAVSYAMKHGPFPEGEPAIATNAEYAQHYARYVLHDRFPAGEAAIAQDSKWAYRYAYDVLQGPFPAGEAAIATDAYYAYSYAYNLLDGPFPAGEPAIARDSSHYAERYADYVLRDPAPKTWAHRYRQQTTTSST